VLKFISVVLAAVSLLLVEATPMKRELEVCPGQVIVSETFIGAESNVKLSEVFCPENVASRSLSARQNNGTVIDVCGDTCNTFCFTPSGGGPNPNDCTVISNALLFESQNVNDTFLIGTGTNNTVALSFNTCETFFVNQDPITESYCLSDWAAIVNFIAPNCQSTQNAHGGLCVAADGQWFIQVQTASA